MFVITDYEGNPQPTMALEIERKFLIIGGEYKDLAKGVFYQQAYLSSDKKRVVRVRTIGSKGFITVKGENIGATRLEFEYEIPLNDANELLEKLCQKPIITKHRYSIPFGNLVWELDEFHGENEGLIIAELELESEDQVFEKPDWIGEEVTGISKYYNVNLIKEPFNKW